jgi:hypothetical protein
MRNSAGFVCVLLGVLTCGGEPDMALPKLDMALPKLENVSGGRLKLWQTAIVGSDGSRLVTQRLWDSMLNTFCNYTIAEDGLMRCLPYSMAFVANNHYSDPECKIRLVTVPRCNEAPSFVTTSVAGMDCGTLLPKVYAVGAKASSIYQIDNSGFCKAASDASDLSGHDR